MSADGRYIRHDPRAKKGDEHFNNVSNKAPKHLQDYIRDEDSKLVSRLQDMENQKKQYSWDSKEADDIFARQQHLKGLEPEYIAARANKLDHLIRGGKLLTSKYKAKSILSGKDINPGDKVYWTSGDGAALVGEVDKYRPKTK